MFSFILRVFITLSNGVKQVDLYKEALSLVCLCVNVFVSRSILTADVSNFS